MQTHKNLKCGFKTNSSTELAITTLHDKLLDNLNNKKTTCSIFLDLKKAFDSVSYDILLKKLERYGLRGSVWKLLNSYLKDRKICTKVDNSISKLHSVKFGVPQGSVLRPLFSCFMLMIYQKHHILKPFYLLMTQISIYRTATLRLFKSKSHWK